jgi:hypothetical protein
MGEDHVGPPTRTSPADEAEQQQADRGDDRADEKDPDDEGIDP